MFSKVGMGIMKSTKKQKNNPFFYTKSQKQRGECKNRIVMFNKRRII